MFAWAGSGTGTGSLTLASETMHAGVGPTAASIAIGVLSAVIDNIPLMFAVLTVNPAIGPGQWLLITLAVL
jgi:Na+/H+ antiporter NhaD/arsenite permease-like protein